MNDSLLAAGIRHLRGKVALQHCKEDSDEQLLHAFTTAELVKSATAAMMVSKTKMAVMVLLAASLLTGASVWAYRGLAANVFMPATQPTELPAAKADDKPKTIPPKSPTTKTVKIEGRVFGADGKPKAGAKILLLDSKNENIVKLGVSAADGRFTVTVPKTAKDGDLIAQADGLGIDFIDLAKWRPEKPVELRLVKDRLIRGRIVNTEGKPIAGVRVAVKSVNIYANNSLDSFLAAWKKRHYMSGVPSGEKHLWTDTADLLPATTNAEGRFIIHAVGNERFAALCLSGAGIADDNLWIVNRDGFDPKPYNQATLDNAPKEEEREAAYWLVHGPDVSIVAEIEKPIRGMVKDADSGKGRPGVAVRLTRYNKGGLVKPIVQAKTDAEGCYQIRGARKMKRYMLEVADDTTAGYLRCQVWSDDTAGYQPITADIKVKKGAIVTGKMIDSATGKPIRGHAMVGVLHNNPFAKDYPSFGNSAWLPRRETDADGNFRVVAIPGPVLLMGGPRDFRAFFQFKASAPDPKYPQYFDTRIPNFPQYLEFGDGMPPIQGCFCKVLRIEPDAKIVKQDIVLERASVLLVHIEDADGKPLPGVWMAGSVLQDFYPAIQCEKADCTAYQVEAAKPRVMVFFHAARKLAGTLTLNGDEKPPIVAKLRQSGALKGRLLDADGKPLAGVVVDPDYRQRAAAEVHKAIHRAKQIVTDAGGMFTLDDAIPQQKFALLFQRGKRKFERTPKLANPAIEVKPGECRDLGAIELKLLSKQTGE